MKFKKFLEPETIGNCFHFKLQFERWTRLQHEKLKKNVNFYLNLMFEIMSGIPTFYYLIFYFLLFIFFVVVVVVVVVVVGFYAGLYWQYFFIIGSTTTKVENFENNSSACIN